MFAASMNTFDIVVTAPIHILNYSRSLSSLRNLTKMRQLNHNCIFSVEYERLVLSVYSTSSSRVICQETLADISTGLFFKEAGTLSPTH